MNDFATDDVWQRQKRDEFVVPDYRRKYVGFALFDDGPFARKMQERGIDTIAWGEDGRIIGIEEKLVRFPGYVYDSICLETETCTVPGRIKRGCMWYSLCDYLLYGMETEDGSLNCLRIDFYHLHRWFWDHEQDFKLHVMPTKNKTASRVVPIKAIERALGYQNVQHFTLLKPRAAQAAE
jgi:hypothetical protein